MNYVKSLKLLGVEARQLPCISGSGAPTTETVGAVGELYMEEETHNIYKCVSENNGNYLWEIVFDKTKLQKEIDEINDNKVESVAGAEQGQYPTCYAVVSYVHNTVPDAVLNYIEGTIPDIVNRVIEELPSAEGASY